MLNAKELRSLTFSQKENKAVSFTLSEKWKHEKKMLGLDHLYTYSHGKTRDLISIIFSPPGKINFTGSRAQEDKKYQEQKLKWLNERGGKIIKFFPLKTSIKGKAISYLFGMSFKIGGRDIIEYSQYYFCDGRLAYFKFLGDNNSSFVKDAQKQVAESFRCVGF